MASPGPYSPEAGQDCAVVVVPPDSGSETDTTVTRTIVRRRRRGAGRPKRELLTVTSVQEPQRQPLDPVSRPGAWSTYCRDDELERETAMLQAGVARALAKSVPRFDDIYNHDPDIPDGHALPNGIHICSQWLRFSRLTLEKEGYEARTIRIADIPKIVDTSVSTTAQANADFSSALAVADLQGDCFRSRLHSMARPRRLTCRRLPRPTVLCPGERLTRRFHNVPNRLPHHFAMQPALPTHCRRSDATACGP